MIFDSKVPERLTLGEDFDEQILHQHLARYEFVRPFVVDRNVLDIACGSGYGSAKLKDAGALSVLGVDVSVEAINHAREHYESPGLTFVLGCAEELASHGMFDVVVSFETIEHLKNPELFLAEAVKILAPGGELVISTPVREHGRLEDRPRNRFHVQEWSSDEFQTMLRQYFQEIVLYGQYNFKRWFPGSRTIQRLIFRTLYPLRFSSVDEFPVLPAPPRHAGFRFEMAVIIAVCRNRTV